MYTGRLPFPQAIGAALFMSTYHVSRADNPARTATSAAPNAAPTDSELPVYNVPAVVSGTKVNFI